ncbi:MAG: LysE family transporter, partial [Rhodospirillaceae bacterium]|nr:LysE family transporter [Rhodospirillaceae bacterium]
MDFVLFAKGAIAGFVIAAPVGPVGIMVAQRTLAKGHAAGLIAGAGGALADTVFGAIAAFGIAFVAAFLHEIEPSLRLGGGILLILLGLLTALKTVKTDARPRLSFARSFGDFATCFILTITNPATIASLIVVFPALGAIVPEGDLARAWTL